MLEIILSDYFYGNGSKECKRKAIQRLAQHREKGENSIESDKVPCIIGWHTLSVIVFLIIAMHG